MRYVLDTSTLSAVMKRDDAILDFLKAHRLGDIHSVPPALAEIHFGVQILDHSSKKYRLLKSELDGLLSVLKALQWNPDASLFFGVIKSNIEKRGELIEDFDIAIGAIAMAHKCAVLTSNLNHFKRIENLDAVSWR